MNPTDNTIIRTRLAETDDSGDQQLVKMSGRKREQYGGPETKVPRGQNYGLSAHVPKGAHAVTTSMGGNPSQTLFHAVEHAPSRPRNLEEGEVILYDDQGQFVWLKRGMIHVKTSKPVLVESDEKITLKAPKVILDSPDIRLGSPDASRDVSAIGTIDSCGCVDTSNFLTRVKGL